jgi:hypothetical protein
VTELHHSGIYKGRGGVPPIVCIVRFDRYRVDYEMDMWALLVEELWVYEDDLLMSMLCKTSSSFYIYTISSTLVIGWVACTAILTRTRMPLSFSPLPRLYFEICM